MFQENIKFNGINCSDATQDLTNKEWSEIGEAGQLLVNAQWYKLNHDDSGHTSQSNLYYGPGNKHKKNEEKNRKVVMDSCNWDIRKEITKST